MITCTQIRSIKTLCRLKNYLLLELETTGNDPELDSIIELGMVRVSEGEVVNRASTRINPETPIPQEVTERTGIWDADVVTAPSYSQIAPSIADLLFGEVVVADPLHIGFIRTLLEEGKLSGELRTVDLESFAAELAPELPEKDLPSLAAYFGLSRGEGPRVLADSVLRYKLLQRCRTYWEAEEDQLENKGRKGLRLFAGIGTSAAKRGETPVKAKPLNNREIVESVASVVCLLASLVLLPSLSCFLLLLAAAVICPFRPLRRWLRRQNIRDWMYAALCVLLVVGALLLKPTAGERKKAADTAGTPPPYILLTWNEPGVYGQELPVDPEGDPEETQVVFRLPRGKYRVLNNNTNAATVTIRSDNEQDELYQEAELGAEVEEALLFQRNGSYTILGSKSQEISLDSDQYITLSENAEKVIFQYLGELPVPEDKEDDPNNPKEPEEVILAYVNGKEVRMRRSPSVDAYIMTTYDTGKEVVVLGVDGDWTRVKVDNRLGYIYSKYLSDTNPLDPQAAEPEETEPPDADVAEATDPAETPAAAETESKD